MYHTKGTALKGGRVMHREDQESDLYSTSSPPDWTASHKTLFDKTKEWYRPHTSMDNHDTTPVVYRHIFFPHSF